MGRRSVSVDVIDLVRFNARVLECVRHYSNRAVAVLGRLRDMKCIARHSVAGDFSVDLSASRFCMLELFENQNACAFTDNEAVSINVERTARVFGIVIARRQGSHCREPPNTHWSDRSFGAAAKHGIGITALNYLEAVAHGVSASRTGSASSGIRSLESEANRDLTRRKVNNRGRNKERRNLARTAFQILLMFAFDDSKSAYARADIGSDSC